MEADEGIEPNGHYLPHIPDFSKSFSKRHGQGICVVIGFQVSAFGCG